MTKAQRTWQAARMAARWTRRHLKLWIAVAGPADTAVIALLAELISRPGQSGQAVKGLILVSLVPLVLSIAFPVAGYILEERDKAAEQKQERARTASAVPSAPIAIPRRFPAHLHGREGLIADLDTAEPGEIVLLCGMGGVGKTAVAAAVAERYEAGGRPAYWVNCLDPQIITASMPEEEEARPVTEGASQAYDIVWRYLDQRHDNGTWLLVLDNADTPLALAPPGGTVADLTGWLRPPRHGRVIVTSRNRDPGTWGTRVRVHDLRPLSPADGVQVLHDRAPDATAVDADVVALSERLGNLPLALQPKNAASSGRSRMTWPKIPRTCAGFATAAGLRTTAAPRARHRTLPIGLAGSSPSSTA
jgi:hypothetical protein